MIGGAPVNTKIPPVIQEIAYCEGVPNKYIRGFTGSVFQAKFSVTNDTDIVSMEVK